MRWVSSLLRQASAGLRLLIALTILLGVLYPFSVWAVSRIPGLHDNAEGAALTLRGKDIGSARIGVDQVARSANADPYFHTRPSASAQGVLGPGDPSTSGGSNLAADSQKLLAAVAQRRELIARREGVAVNEVPADAVTASGSGVDPDISPAYAQLQSARVARVTGLGDARVRQLVEEHTHGRELGFLGDPGVNVGELNLAIRQATGG